MSAFIISQKNTLPRFILSIYLALMVGTGSGLAQEKSITIAEEQFKNSQFIEAEKTCREIMAKEESKNAISEKAKAHRIIAAVCATYSRKTEQIEHLFNSLWFYRQLNKPKEEAEALRLIGQYYLHMALTAKAREYLKEAFNLASASQDTLSMIRIISNQAQVEGGEENYVTCYKLFNQAIRLSSEINFRDGLRDNWDRLAYSQGKEGHYDRMLYSMLQSEKYIGTNTDTAGIIYGDLGFAYMKTMRYDSAEYFLLKGLTEIRKGHNKIQELTLYKFLADVYEKQNRYKEANYYLNEHLAMEKQVFTSRLLDQVGYAEYRHNELASIHQLQLMQTRSRFMTWFLAGGIVLLIVAMFVIYRLRYTNQVIESQQKELAMTHADLLKSEGLFRQLFDNTQELISTHTLDGYFLSVNPAVVALLNLPDDEIIGKSISYFLHPDFAREFPKYLDQVINQGKSSGWMRINNGKGGFRILRYQNNIVHQKNGEAYIIAFSQDQTEMFEARFSSRREHKRLQIVMENSPDIYSILTSDGRIQYMNRSNYFDVQRIVGAQINTLLSAEQGDRFMEQLRKTATSKSIITIEESFYNHFYLTKLIPILENNEVREILSVNTDITDIRKNQAELRKLSSIVEQASNLILTTDHEGNINWVNASFERVTGYSLEEAKGKNPSWLLYGPETDPAVIQYINDQFSREEAFECEIINYTKEDQKYWVSVYWKPMFTTERQFEGYFSVQQDITTEKIALEKMKEAKELAEESNRLKTIFLGSLSHEVRTPLQGILGLSEVLEDSVFPRDKQLQFLSIIKQRAFDLQNIIDSLLDLASLETGEIKTFPIATNLTDLVFTIFENIREEYQLKSDSVILRLDNRIRPAEQVMIDPVHVRQVIQNLVRNAMKFTNEGYVTLTVEYNHDELIIRITDTGIGIPQEKQRSIFEPFRQAHEGLSRSRGGIGLGLSICKKMVELWGGTIGVTSEPGEGSTFYFSIPGKLILNETVYE